VAAVSAPTFSSFSVPQSASIPTLSAIEGWDTEYLNAAAAHWTTTAETWEIAFTEVSSQMPAPGGTPWQGAASSAAQERAYSDRLRVIGTADELHGAAAVARAGSTELLSAKQGALSAISQARAAGFLVSEDLSVSHPGRVSNGNVAAVRAEAQGFADTIRSRAMVLATVDQQLAAKLSTSAATVAKTSFDDSKTQMLGFGPRDPKQSPPTDALSVKDANDVHKRVDPLPPGKNRGVKVLPNAAAVEALYAELTKNGTPLPPGTYKGEWEALPDGTKIGFRPDSKSGGPTVEIWNPDGSKMWDVHVGDPPKRPPPMPAPVPVPVPAPAPVAVPSPESPSLPDIGSVPPLPDPSPVDVVVGGIAAVGVGIITGIEELGKWAFSP